MTRLRAFLRSASAPQVRLLARWRARLAEALVRRRVTLGFLVGALVLWLAEPTWTSMVRSFPFVLAGEALRVWAAGHLQKSREITRSGPYQRMRHPLYFGTALIAIGLAMASASRPVSLVIALYVGTAIPAAVLAEEKHLREKFGGDYDAYKAHQAPPMTRRFSLARALDNREHHTITGVAIGFALLALKVQLSIR